MPRTNVPESAAPRMREGDSVAPKMATVIGTIGNTHGVSALMKPNAKDIPAATMGL